MNTREVWKVSLADSLTHALPMGAEALYADYQLGSICVWLLANPQHRRLNRSFLVAGTGWSMPEWIKRDHYIGSCRNPDNLNCWHIFDLGYTDSVKPHYESRLRPWNTKPEDGSHD